MRTTKKYPLELNTMPGFAGSSAYYIRYQYPHNDNALVSKEINDYWGNVDLYLGGTEHATGHLIYSRFWNKFLYDLGVVSKEEPFQKLINQGMIQGRSNFVYRFAPNPTLQSAKKVLFVSKNIRDACEQKKQEFLDNKCSIEELVSFVENQIGNYFSKNNYTVKNDPTDYRKLIGTMPIFTKIHVDINHVNNDILDEDWFKNKFRNGEFKDATFKHENGKYICGWELEKMSKSKLNVVNPDDIVEKYGADTLRMYEMFLGPLEQSKPWDTNGIDGVHRFLKKLWGLFYKENNLVINNENPVNEELKSLHKLIKKIAYDIEHFSFNTSISAFMICVNELAALKCNKKDILEPLVIVLSPFAPHIAEELYHALGNTTTVCDARFPEFDEKYLVESSVKYPVSFNGKVRFTLDLLADMPPAEVEKTALANEQTGKFLEGKTIKKVIVVPGKIVNVVF
jgi:leucyl-tRNA synthetase